MSLAFSLVGWTMVTYSLFAPRKGVWRVGLFAVSSLYFVLGFYYLQSLYQLCS